MTWKIKIAQTSDAWALTQLTIASKAYWGYSREQMRLWTEVLSVYPDYIQQHEVFVLWDQEIMQGYYAYKQEVSHILLDNLFVHPRAIGKGWGKLLLNDFEARLKAGGETNIRLVSEPQAETFYKKYGYTTIDQKESSIPGRYLPVMQKQLTR